MEWFLNHVAENFEEYLIVSLIVTLFFRESVMAFVNAKLGREDTPAWGRKATNEIARLAEYANHDTTERLNTIHAQGVETRDALKSIDRTLSEIKEYGIPCRDKK